MAQGEAKRGGWKGGEGGGGGLLVAGSKESEREERGKEGGRQEERWGLCVVQAEGASLAKQTSSNLVQKQSPKDINFTCVQSR